MLYAIISDDVENSLEKRWSVRPAHIERLEKLQNAGRLVLAGPCPSIDSSNPGTAGFTGSLVVAEFDSLTTAQQWAEDDPYNVAGVYSRVIVKPFKKVFPQ